MILNYNTKRNISFKLSDNTLNFILENIDSKDFLDNDFINSLNYIISQNDLKKLKNIYLKNIVFYKNCAGYCTDFNIILNKPILDGSFSDLCVCNPNIYDTISQKNLFTLFTLFHELGHIYQRECMIKFCSDSLEYNYIESIKDLLYLSNKVRYGNINKYKGYPTFIKRISGNKLYNMYHDIFPSELHADGFSVNIIEEIISYMFNREEYRYFEYYLLKGLLKRYKYDNKLISPLELFCNEFNLNEYNQILNYNYFNEKEKVLFGISNNEKELNKQLSILLGSNHIKEYTKVLKIN